MRRSRSYMKTCKFFLQGTCYNGDRCRFSHETLGSSRGFGSQSQLQTQSPFTTNGDNLSTTQGVTMTESGWMLAIEELQHPPIWKLSGFAVTKGLPSLVTGDVSCEEARWEAYQEMKIAGNCIQSTQRFHALAAEQQAQRQRVVSMLENHQLAQRLFNGEPLPEEGGYGAANPFGGGKAASPFGRTSSLFGGTTTGANPFSGRAATPVSSSFGNSATPETSAANPFGGGNITAFGGAAANPFGGGSSTTDFRTTSAVGAGGGAQFGGSAATNPFGGADATPTSATRAVNVFGAPSRSAFGGAATPSSSPFGGGVSATVSPFGNGALAPTAAFSAGGTGSEFTGAGTDAAKSVASPFVVGAATPASSRFGVSSVATPFDDIPGAISSLNPFGDAASSKNATATSFGESSSRFNSSSGSTTVATNPFGASRSPFALTSSSPIRASTASTSTTSKVGGFSNSRSSELTSSAPSPPPAAAISGLFPDVRDDSWNAVQFQQAEFSLGMVPTVPPPPQFC